MGLFSKNRTQGNSGKEVAVHKSSTPLTNFVPRERNNESIADAAKVPLPKNYSARSLQQVEKFYQQVEWAIKDLYRVGVFKRTMEITAQSAAQSLSGHETVIFAMRHLVAALNQHGLTDVWLPATEEDARYQICAELITNYQHIAVEDDLVVPGMTRQVTIKPLYKRREPQQEQVTDQSAQQ